ncbi:GGDEF domain-containing protein [Rhodanobacter aciditrophus]|uniref:diguanylate cyclase n=1 Tax=Rhodanobacter aciditrophus TaxID=1623218 RepID=A0ABW4B635_9GAMM
MSISNNILHHIENFTAQRDKELLAFSLLKSIRNILTPVKASILTLNSKDEPTMEITLASSDKCRFNHKNIHLPPEIKKSIEYMNSWQLDEFVDAYDHQHVSFHLLKQSRQNAQYLVITLDKKPSKSENYIIKGMLSIYSNFSSLLIEAQTDELTGLMNRKTFEESIVKLYQKFDVEDDEHTEQSNWIAIIDLDHFKNINDNFGHLYGDEVLIHVSRVMQQTFRHDDLLFRFGGEEFVILMKNRGRKDCERVLEALRQNVQNIKLPNIDAITVSIGVCEFNDDVFHITLMDRADQALYYSKQHGRNQITFFDQVVAEGLAVESQVNAGEIDLF